MKERLRSLLLLMPVCAIALLGVTPELVSAARDPYERILTGSFETHIYPQGFLTLDGDPHASDILIPTQGDSSGMLTVAAEVDATGACETALIPGVGTNKQMPVEEFQLAVQNIPVRIEQDTYTQSVQVCVLESPKENFYENFSLSKAFQEIASQTSENGRAMSVDESIRIFDIAVQLNNQLPPKEYALNEETLQEWSARLDKAFKESDIVDDELYERFEPYQVRLEDFRDAPLLVDLKRTDALGVTYCVPVERLKTSPIKPEDNNVVSINARYITAPEKITDKQGNPTEDAIIYANFRERQAWWLWTTAHEKAHQVGRVCGAFYSNIAEAGKIETTANLIALRILADMVQNGDEDALHALLYGFRATTSQNVIYQMLDLKLEDQLPALMDELVGTPHALYQAEKIKKEVKTYSGARAQYKDVLERYGFSAVLYTVGAAIDVKKEAGGGVVFVYDADDPNGGELVRRAFPFDTFFAVMDNLNTPIVNAGGTVRPIQTKHSYVILPEADPEVSTEIAIPVRISGRGGMQE